MRVQNETNCHGRTNRVNYFVSVVSSLLETRTNTRATDSILAFLLRIWYAFASAPLFPTTTVDHK